MSTLEDTLAAELQSCRDQEHALHVRAAHVQSALTLARQGVDEGIIRATLESKGVIVLVRPGAAVDA